MPTIKNNTNFLYISAIVILAGALFFQSSYRKEFKQSDDYVTPQMFGAAADGVTDDSIAFQHALETGKPVYVDGTFLVNKVICSQNADMYFSSDSEIIRDTTDEKNSSGLFEFIGKANGKILLKEESGELQKTLILEDTSSLAVGDYICVKNETDVEELKYQLLTTRITSVSGEQITVADPLQWSFAPQNGAYVTIIEPIEVRLHGNGCRFSSTGKIGRGYMIYLEYCVNSIVEDFNVSKISTGISRLNFCYDVMISNCDGKEPVTTEIPYGEMLSIAFSSQIKAYDISTIGYRRCVDYIGAAYCTCSGSRVSGGGFTTHGMLSRYCVFENCMTVCDDGSIHGSTIGNKRYYYDKDITFKNCSFYGGNYSFLALGDKTTCTLDSCVLKNNLTTKIECEEFTAVNCQFYSRRTILNCAHPDVKRVLLKNCVLESTGKGSYDALLGKMTLENCDINTTTSVSRSAVLQMYDCNCSGTISTMLTVNSDSIIKGCTFNRNISIADGAENVIIKDCVIRGILVPGANKNVTISDIIYWDKISSDSVSVGVYDRKVSGETNQ